MDASGRRLAHTAGRSGWPKIRQRSAPSSCTQATPAGLPCGMPGIGELIEGAVQHAAQPLRQAREDDGDMTPVYPRAARTAADTGGQARRGPLQSGAERQG